MPIDGYQLCVAYASSSNSCYIIKCNQQRSSKKKKLNVNQFSQTESTSQLLYNWVSTSGGYIAQCGWRRYKAGSGCTERPIKWVKFSTICYTALWHVELLGKRYKWVHDLRHCRSEFLYRLCERHKFCCNPKKKREYNLKPKWQQTIMIEFSFLTSITW